MSATAKFVSTGQAATALGCDRTHVWRLCEAHPGLARRVGNRWKISVDHVCRLQEGEDAAAIAANPSPSAVDAMAVAAAPIRAEGLDAEQAAKALRNLARAYFFARGLGHYDVPAEAREIVIARIAEDVRAVIKNLDLLRGGSLRNAIIDTGSLNEFHYVTRIRAEIRG